MKKLNTITHRTLNGDFIASFGSTVEAAELTGIPYSTIRYGVNGRKTKKFTFDQQNRQAMHNAARGKMRITQRDRTGLIKAVYADLDVASAMTGIKVHDIQSVLNKSSEVSGSTFNG